jgi:hypothetical protein
VDRKDSIIKKAIPPKIPGFSMLDTLGRDYASQLITKNSTVYVLFMHNLDEVNPKGIQSNVLQSLVSACEKQNIHFVAVTNSSEAEIQKFIARYKITFPIYFNPIDPVKGPFMVRDAVRSNPGLMLIKNGVVINKWSWRNFPEKL